METGDIYCVVVFPAEKRAFCFDRGYNQLPQSDLWKTLRIANMIECIDGYTPPHCSEECRALAHEHRRHYTVWFKQSDEKEEIDVST